MFRLALCLALVLSLGCEEDDSEDTGSLDTVDVSTSDTAIDTTTDTSTGDDTRLDTANTDTPSDTTADDTRLDTTNSDVSSDAADADTGPQPGDIGTSCAIDDDCNTSICEGSICAGCRVTSDCSIQQACEDSGLGYKICVGTGSLGENCTDDSVCSPDTFCTEGVCSRCDAEAACEGGGSCVLDTDVGYAWCSGGLGDPCSDGSDCETTSCFKFSQSDPTGRCSECTTGTDCILQQTCEPDLEFGYARCVGTGGFGENCTDDGQCAPRAACVDGICSACRSDDDCEWDLTCTFSAVDGYTQCMAEAIGDLCPIPYSCIAGPCRDNVCAECESNNDCAEDERCLSTIPYARCVGLSELGVDCTDGGDCASGFCNSGVCSECETDRHCGPGSSSCNDDTSRAGYFTCTRDLGALCEEDDACDSGICGLSPLEFTRVCSECKTEQDCGSGQVCGLEEGTFYSVCVGNIPLGLSCDTTDQCREGRCIDSLCQRCESDAECGTGGTCDDHFLEGYDVCDGLGDTGCTESSHCTQSLCFEGPRDNVCSECLVEEHCLIGEQCLYDSEIGYARCR